MVGTTKPVNRLMFGFEHDLIGDDPIASDKNSATLCKNSESSRYYILCKFFQFSETLMFSISQIDVGQFYHRQHSDKKIDRPSPSITNS